MTLKFHRVVLPRCPQVKLARMSFRKANRIIREARSRYKEQLWIAAAPLKGKALDSFLVKAAARVQDAGLYSAATNCSDIAYSLALYMYRRDMPGMYGGWSLWRERRQINLESVRSAARRLRRVS